MSTPDSKMPSSKAKITPTALPPMYCKLRRFASLRWVVQEDSEGLWLKTGHILVMDMDDRSVRHRHLWFVLASEWPTDGERETFSCRAEEIVLPGVFPGDRNRTPICSIRPVGKSANNKDVVLKQFGEDFTFEPVRLGGHRTGRDRGDHPKYQRLFSGFVPTNVDIFGLSPGKESRPSGRGRRGLGSQPCAWTLDHWKGSISSALSLGPSNRSVIPAINMQYSKGFPG